MASIWMKKNILQILQIFLEFLLLLFAITLFLNILLKIVCLHCNLFIFGISANTNKEMMKKGLCYWRRGKGFRSSYWLSQRCPFWGKSTWQGFSKYYTFQKQINDQYKTSIVRNLKPVFVIYRNTTLHHPSAPKVLADCILSTLPPWGAGFRSILDIKGIILPLLHINF